MSRKRSSNESVPQRTSSFHLNRRNFMTDDGGYMYYVWDEEKKTEIPLKLSVGDISPLDGKVVTQETIVLLDQMDHDEDLGDRYEEENADFRMRNAEVAAEDDDGAHTPAIENLPDPAGDPAALLSLDEMSEDPRIAQLRAFLETLTQEQQDLCWDYFGQMLQQTEIAAAENAAKGTNISRQTINMRLRRILKLAAECFGVEPPKKQVHKRKE